MSELLCRFCKRALRHTFVDLGSAPISNAYLAAEDLDRMEPFFPLHVRVCDSCWLVQLPELEPPERIFGSDYAYFSSYSSTWLEHCRRYALDMAARWRLGPESLVVEIGSNDGYLLQYFAELGIPVLGIEPTANTAAAAERKGVPSLVKFFGSATACELAREGKKADLLVGNNVLAHVPDLNDFVSGMKTALKAAGTITMEFPHLLELMRNNQFDTIYHEHFSYLSLVAVDRVFSAHGLRIFDVEELPTHGGSLRIHAAHEGNAIPDSPRLHALLDREREAGLERIETYAGFAGQVHETKRALLELLIRLRRQGKRIAGYGAPAKGNTLLNYCGIRGDFVEYTVDRSPQKQGRYLPGTRIPIFAPDKVAETRPDYLLILPWNLRDEIMEQMAHIRAWQGRFIVPIPRPEILT